MKPKTPKPKRTSKLTTEEHAALARMVDSLDSTLGAMLVVLKNSPKAYSAAIDLDIEVENLKDLLKSLAAHNYGETEARIYDWFSDIPF